MRPTNSEEREEMLIQPNKFEDQLARRSFVRRVYALLACALAATGVQLLIVMLNDELMIWFQQRHWIIYVCFGVYLVSYLILSCSLKMRKSFPTNFVLFALVVESLTGITMYLAARFEPSIVLAAFGLTSAVCLLLTLLALTVPIDFTTKTLLLSVLCIILLVLGIAVIAVQLISPSHTLRIVYAGVVVVVLGIFFVYETQMIFGNKHYALDPDDTVYGALTIYVSFIQMFHQILILLNECLE